MALMKFLALAIVCLPVDAFQGPIGRLLTRVSISSAWQRRGKPLTAQLEAEKQEGLTQVAAEDAFNKFDTNQDGIVSYEEFKTGLEKDLQLELPGRRVKELMDDIDTNGDGAIQVKEFVTFAKSKGRRLNPADVAKAARKECTHVLICPGFATSSKDYSEEGSLAPNLVGRNGLKKEQVHVLPMKRTDWLSIWPEGLKDKDFVSALVGIPGAKGAPPDHMPYRWYLKRVAQVIRQIDQGVKDQYGDDTNAKVILIGHSAGGWLARAAVGYGWEHKQNSTELEKELGIDIDNILAIVTLGTPNRPPPDGYPDVTGGALRITNERFPGSYFEDKCFYLTAAGSGVDGKTDAMAYQAYKQVGGEGTADGDGIVPTGSAHLDGATQVNLRNIAHAAQLVASNVGEVWYGSNVVVDEWFAAIVEQLHYIQNADKVLQDPILDLDVNPPIDSEMKTQGLVKSGTEGEPYDTDEGLVESKEAGVENYFRRRNALRYSGIFSNIPNRKAFESLVFSMEGFDVPIGTKVFTQGDDSDAMYFVRKGEFEIFEEKTGKVIATVGKNQVVGELGVLLGEPRALSFRASSAYASVYKLSSDDIKKYVLEQESTFIASSLQNDTRYGRYFEEKGKRDALKACPLFKELAEDDVKRLLPAMQRMEIPAGERIIEEGSRGGSMYFVKDGGFVCYRESNKNVVKICEKGDYFGELGVIFERPRAVSVRATRPSSVYELHGDAFLDCYRKMTVAKVGAASWVLALGKVVRAEKWINRLIPKPVSRVYHNLCFAVGNFINQFELLGGHFEDGPRKGTNTHLKNALISVAIPMYFLLARASAGSFICKLIMQIGFAGLVVDNLINASGKYIGEGDTLRRLCKLRSISHGLTIPLTFIPVIEIAMKSGLFPQRGAKIAMCAVAAFAAYEVIDWLSFDIKDMVVVDNRDSKKHSPRALAGTLWYTSGKVLKNVLPAAILQLFMLIVGSILWKSGAAGGPWLFLSAVITLISCSLQRPDIQAYGEPTMLGLIWAGAAASV